MAAATARPSSGVRTRTDLGYTGTPSIRESRRGNVVGAEHLSQRDPGQVGDHHVARMRMHYGLYIGAGPEQLGVDVEFVGNRITAVEVAATIEVNDADIVGDGEQAVHDPRVRGSAAGSGRHPAER